LFYPSVTNEWLVAKKLAQDKPKSSNLTEVFVGIHDRFNLGEYITLDGKLSMFNLHDFFESTSH
jgi:hypothetical protein